MNCSCCDWWSQSPVIQRSNSAYTRKCKASGNKITADSKSCKYFNPKFFFCDQFGHRIAFTQCLARRRNEKNFSSWDICKNCRQFEKEIREIIQNYYLDVVPITAPRHLRKKETPHSGQVRKIKRRDKKEKPKRSIKRRATKEKPKRSIKRRSPLTKALDELLPKAKRKIKRRDHK